MIENIKKDFEKHISSKKFSKKVLNEKKNIDEGAKSHVSNDYLKYSIKNKSKNILNKIKKIKSYG